MWPWEHVLFAYVFYSIYVHLRWQKRPFDAPTVALAVGSVIPDLIDKPLAWQFGVFESGYALAHSAFVVVPAAAAIYLFAERRGRGPVGAAYGVGHLFHLVGDVLPVSLSHGALDLTPILWPIAGNPRPADRTTVSFFDGVYTLLSEYVAELATLDLTPVIALQIGSLIFGLVLWTYDGFPGPRLLVRWVWLGGRSAVHR